MTKQQIRTLIKERKKLLSETDSHKESALVMGSIEKTKAFKNADAVLVYWSLPDEIRTVEFLEKWRDRKRICLPVMKGKELLIKQYLRGCVINKANYGISEPDGPLIDPSEIDFAVIPGVAFDKNNNRLGRGKGFYDRLLKQMDAVKAGVCYGFQIVDEIPAEPHDVKMDLVIYPEIFRGVDI
ncbi:MAG: 5-formyltetrahydrofolate cyclo-ligase [Rikenellaceae bacterium]|nr:5-formyltetrahydrofolate cyclo-ligase [Rikenellaceae bacterium]